MSPAVPPSIRVATALRSRCRACGMTLFMMLHGRPAFMAATLPEIYALITTQPVVWTATEGEACQLCVSYGFACIALRHFVGSTPEESKDFLLARDLALGLLEKVIRRRVADSHVDPPSTLTRFSCDPRSRTQSVVYRLIPPLLIRSLHLLLQSPVISRPEKQGL